MSTTTEHTEYLYTRQTADRYRRQGYEVSMECPLDFMDGFTADLLARKDDDLRVVEVKTRASIGADPRIAELAGIVEAKPGWSFDLVVVPEPERLEAPVNATPYDESQVRRRTDVAAQLLDAGHAEAALLMAWSACEATLRLQNAKVETARDLRITTSRYVLEEATHLGVIFHEEYDRLLEIARYCNAVSHGFTHDSSAASLVAELIETLTILSARDPLGED